MRLLFSFQMESKFLRMEVFERLGNLFQIRSFKICPTIAAQKSAKLSKENGIKLVGYTFRLKNYVTMPHPPFLSDFSKLAPPLVSETFLSSFFLKILHP